MNCPDARQWAAWLEGDVSPRVWSLLEKHARECEPCRLAVATVERLETLLRDALSPDVDAERLAETVRKRLRSAD